MAITIRDIMIAFGFDLNAESEAKANDAVQQLKTVANDALNAIDVGFDTDKASEQKVLDSVETIKSEAKPLEDNKVGYSVDKGSEAAAKNSIRKFRMFAVKALGAIGLSVSFFKVLSKLQQVESVATAIEDVKKEWAGWVTELDKTYGITDMLSRTVVGLSRNVISFLRKSQDGFIKLSNKVGGVDKLLRLVAMSAGAIYLALKGKLILDFLSKFSAGLTKAHLKTLAIAAIFLLLALIIEDFINFMKGNDSLLGKLLEKAGIDADKVRETIFNAWEQVKVFTAAALDWLRDKWDKWGGYITAYVLTLFALILSTFKNGFDIIKAIFGIFAALFSGDWEGLWESVKALLSAVWEQIKAIFQAAVDILLLILASLFGTSVEDIKNWFENVKSWFTKAADFIKSTVDKIVGFFQPFIDIIEKITGFVGSGLGKAADLIGKITGGGKEPKPTPGFAGGTGSTPDTFIAGEEGPELITGAAGRKVFTAAETGDIFQTLKDMAGMATTPQPDTVAANVSSIESNVINMNVKIGNTFNGDRAGQEKSSEAMDNATDDMTGGLARALAYLR